MKRESEKREDGRGGADSVWLHGVVLLAGNHITLSSPFPSYLAHVLSMSICKHNNICYGVHHIHICKHRYIHISTYAGIREIFYFIGPSSACGPCLEKRCVTISH